MHRNMILGAAVVALMAFAASRAQAAIITFSEFSATNNDSPLTDLYSRLGVTFDDRNSGIWQGIASGDPGAWGVKGTNGPQFLGNNGLNNSDSYSESIFFAAPQISVSFDASRANGSSSGQTLTANAYDASNDLLASDTITLGDINVWSSFDLKAVGIARVYLIGSAASFSPYAVDNLQFNSAGVPEPSALIVWSLLGTLGLGLGWWRTQKAG